MLDQIVSGLETFFIAAPGVILTGFSLYFTYQRIGNKVEVNFKVLKEDLSEVRISKLNLINLKNKPLTIFSIESVINNDIVIEVEKFSPPIILKGLESMQIEAEPYSCLDINGDVYKPDLFRNKDIDIYLIIGSKKVKCEITRPPELTSHFGFSHYRRASKNIFQYNGIVYDDSALYALLYKKNGESRTAFILSNGRIVGDWSCPLNQLPDGSLESTDKLREVLNNSDIKKYIDSCAVDRLPR
jgi:hypothetical protein